MSNEHLPLLPLLLHRVEPMMEAEPSLSPSSPTGTKPDLPEFKFPPGLVYPDIANIAKLADSTAVRFHATWDQRVQDQTGTDGDIKPQLRPTTYEMTMTLLTLGAPKPLPTEPLPPPTQPARPPFQLDLPFQIKMEEFIQEFEAVVYRFTSPESLLPLFNELGQTIRSNDWLRFFLIRQPYRLPVGTEVFYGVLRWYLWTDELFISAFLAQKMDPRLKAEVNYYIPAARGIKTIKEWHKVWATAIDDVAKVRRKFGAGVSLAFHAKLSEARDRNLKDTPQSTPRRRRTPRSSLDQELRAGLNWG